MKKFALLIATFILVFTLTSCDDVCVGPECLGEVSDGGATEYTPGNGFMMPFTHINGEGHEEEQAAYILLDYKLRDYVKYQVAYLSCTCRAGDVNYWNVAFIEVNMDNTIKSISFGHDYDADGEEGHYYAGVWGDSSGAPEQNGVTFEMFESRFFPWFIGKSLVELEGLNVWTNSTMYDSFSNEGTIDDQTLIDDFAGSSVSTNNFLRVVKELLHYHEDKYAE